VLRRRGLICLTTGNFSEFQSAYRVGHCTETALLKVVIVTAAGDRLSSVLLSLGILAAFDIIESTTILLDRACGDDVGDSSNALDWLQAFVSDRKQYVAA